MARRSRPVSIAPEDLALFKREVEGAVPIQNDRIVPKLAAPHPYPRHSNRDEAQALIESLNPPLLDLLLEGGDEAAWLRPGVRQSVLRDLRRGRWAVQDHLDLHGCNREKAREMVVDFLNHAEKHELRCLRIVHGKGLSSPGREPVLKRLVYGWLAQRQQTLAFCQARANDGGSGAVLILLRLRTKK